MSIKDLFSIIAEKVKFDLTVKKKQLEKEHNIELGNQILMELYSCLSSNHSYLLNLGITEDVRAISFKDNLITIGLPKVDIYRDYSSGDARKVCERLNQLLIKYLQYEYNQHGRENYRLCFPNLPRIQFLYVLDHSVELIATLKLN